MSLMLLSLGSDFYFDYLLGRSFSKIVKFLTYASVIEFGVLLFLSLKVLKTKVSSLSKKTIKPVFRGSEITIFWSVQHKTLKKLSFSNAPLNHQLKIRQVVKSSPCKLCTQGYSLCIKHQLYVFDIRFLKI